MKKAFSILLSLLILISSTGATVAVHHCPKSKKTSYSLIEVKSCCKKAKMDNNCCKNSTVKVEKIEDAFTPSSLSKIPSPELSTYLIAFANALLSSTFVSKSDLPLLSYQVQPPESVSLTILYRTILV